jgi:drug/metabolite transporter (DMT)-like permease
MHRAKTKIIGVACILIAAVIWAIEPVLARYSDMAKGGSGDFLQIATVRALFVMIIGLLYSLLRKDSFHTTKKQLTAVVTTALVASVVADLLYYYCLFVVPAVNAVLIGHLQPLFVVIVGFAFLREDRLSFFDYSGMFLMIVAAVFVVSKTGDNLLHFRIGGYGDLLVLLSTVLWAIGCIIMRRNIRGMQAGVITTYRFAVAVACYFVFLILRYDGSIRSIPGFDRYEVALGILVGIGYVLYYEGLKRIKAAQVGSLELAGPVFAALFGMIYLGENVTFFQCAGMVLLFPGIYLLSKREKE